MYNFYKVVWRYRTGNTDIKSLIGIIKADGAERELRIPTGKSAISVNKTMNTTAKSLANHFHIDGSTDQVFTINKGIYNHRAMCKVLFTDTDVGVDNMLTTNMKPQDIVQTLIDTEEINAEDVNMKDCNFVFTEQYVFYPISYEQVKVLDIERMNLNA